MKPSEWVEKFRRMVSFSKFPRERFSKSCLIYSKGLYGIFLVEDREGKRYTVKVSSFAYGIKMPYEVSVGLYLKKFASNIPNLLHLEDIFIGENPESYSLFSKPKLEDSFCRDKELFSIFKEKIYIYILTKACYYNLGYYLGKHKGTLSYYAFVGFSFQLLVGLQTLHRLGIWHRDVKAANVLVCDSEIAKTYSNIVYKYGNEGKWVLSYPKLGNRDLKWIDFGESGVYDEIDFPCKTFEYEVNVASVNIINLMWKKVEDKLFPELYEDFVKRLQTCSTSLVDVLFNSPIFNVLKEKEEIGSSFQVDLLQF